MEKFTIPLLLTAAICLMLGSLPCERTLDATPPDNPVFVGNTLITGPITVRDGVISPGFSPGKITIDGNLYLGGSSSYVCELKDLSGPGLGHDQIEVTGSVVLGGTLEIVLDGYVPNDGNHFAIITYGVLQPSLWSSINWPPGMDAWQIDYGSLFPNSITIYGPTALPVEWLNFRATAVGREVQLTWQTASEENSNYFAVEHSTDARAFSELARVPAQGNSEVVQYYAFTHHHLTPGLHYYRLKQMDLDGAFTYSIIRSISLGGRPLTFFPNPATRTITFNHPVESVRLLDLLGREVRYKTDVGLVFSVADIAPGAYILQVNHGELIGRLIIR
ncbi:MAG: T9SS type A sorting domain-containing protein [Lewinella sp.]|nr:T9SS type A sorting domain-containing protein [Lewinella sp.]